jgi:hypothetical protein
MGSVLDGSKTTLDQWQRKMIDWFPGGRLDRDIVLAITGLWLATVVLVYWDSGRRRLPARERAAWLLLTLLPFLGAALYFWRKNRTPLAPSPPGGRRITWLRPPDQPAGGRLATIAAADVRDGVSWTNAAATGGRYLLWIAGGPSRGRNVELSQLPAVIGRGGDCAVSLDDDPAV